MNNDNVSTGKGETSAFGKLSGPDALLGFNFARACCTRSSVTSRKIGK